jgi:hypothetical protein
VSLRKRHYYEITTKRTNMPTNEGLFQLLRLALPPRIVVLSQEVILIRKKIRRTYY